MRVPGPPPRSTACGGGRAGTPEDAACLNGAHGSVCNAPFSSYAGVCLEGLGVDKDTEAGLRWLTEAAHAGDPHSQYNLAVFHAEGGAGLVRDGAKAAEWFRKAAKRGSAPAQ